MSVEKRVLAFLQLAEEDVNAAELLLAGKNRYAAYHLQQATEKLIKAVLLARRGEAGVEHRIETLLERLPGEDSWRVRLSPFEIYSAYATTFRYPTPGGRIPQDPGEEDVRRDALALRGLLAAARSELFPIP
jgi:HEPN domain-containing protein